MCSFLGQVIIINLKELLYLYRHAFCINAITRTKKNDRLELGLNEVEGFLIYFTWDS